MNLASLNPEQRLAVEHKDGPLMILAGAGTGKTKVITARIQHLIRGGVSASSVAAMTFTNKAAKEMKERLLHALGPETTRKLSISTFHRFCLLILRKYHKEIGLTAKFQLIGTSDQLDLIRKAMDEMKWAGLYRPENILAQISYCKNQLLTPSDLKKGIFPEAIEDETQQEIVTASYELYERFLSINQGIDFDDCILKAVQLLQRVPEVKEALGCKWTHVLVDEFQDTNLAQFSFLKELLPSHGNICVVGDDDQSIYSWRGAMYETIKNFEDYFTGCKMVVLEQNYRCSNVILGAANHIIKNNPIRKEKNLWSASNIDKPIELAPHQTKEEESKWIARKILALYGQNFQGKDIGILYRTNSQAKDIEAALREHRIFYKTYGGQSFFEKKEIRDFFAYLRLIIYHDDFLSFYKIINTPSRGLGVKTQEIIASISKEHKIPPFRACIRLLESRQLASHGDAQLQLFIDKIFELSFLPRLTSDDLLHLAEKIIDTFDFVSYIKQTTKDPFSAHHKIENLKKMPAFLQKMAAEDLLEGKTIDDLIDSLTLSQPDFDQQEGKNDQFVSLMSIHAAKGLEFPHVFITGLEEGVLPHKNSLEDYRLICEERRLFYVAITRAKESLFISYAKESSDRYEIGKEKKPSRFLEELPEDLGVRATTSCPITKEKEQKQNTLKKLSSLRQSLS